MKTAAILVAAACLTAACRPSVLAADGIRKDQPAQTDQAVAARFERYDKLASEPTPPTWRPGARWQFEAYDSRGKMEAKFDFEVTDEPADTCVSGKWKQLVALDGTKSTTHRPAYLLEGRNLSVLLSTALCDAYDEFRGELSADGFSGRHESSGLFGGKDHGKVVGNPAPANP